MAVIEGYYEEIYSMGSKCSKFEWVGNDFIFHIDYGMDINEGHPLHNSILYETPCKVIFKDAIKAYMRLNIGGDKYDFIKQSSEKEGVVYLNFEFETDCTYSIFSGYSLFWEIRAREICIDDLQP